MIRSDLIARLAEQNPHLSEKEREGIVKAILNRIAWALEDGDRVELRGFGCFTLRELQARTSRNPRTGEHVETGVKKHIRFMPGRVMKARLNRE